MKVAILMSTYNGEKYLREQIESLQKQTFKKWELFIRDDGSTDNTISVINKLQVKDSRIHFLNDKKIQLRPMKSFLYLLSNVSADFYFFCDQDDYWLPEKLDLMLKVGKLDKPQLVYCGLKCVNQNLIPLKNDFENMMGTIWGYSRFIGNDMPGCVMMFNSKLRNIAISSTKTYEGIVMHDWWIALIAQTFGTIKFLNKRLVLYRQHGNNSIGAGKNGNLMRKMLQRGVIKKQKKLVYQTYNQSVVFFNTFKNQLPKANKAFLEDYINSPQKGLLYRDTLFKKYKLKGTSRIRLLAYKTLFVFNLNNILKDLK